MNKIVFGLLLAISLCSCNWIERHYNYETLAESDGLFLVKKDNKMGYVDRDNITIIPIKYDAVGRFASGIAAINLNQKWGFVDKKGVEICSLKYDKVGSFLMDHQFADVYIHDKAGLINKSGKEVLAPITYNSIDLPFNNGFATVRVDQRIGIIDKNGAEIIHPYYTKIDSFDKGFFKVFRGTSLGLFTKDGKEFLSPVFDHIELIPDQKLVKVSKFLTKRGKKIWNSNHTDWLQNYGLLNYDGTIILKAIQDNIVIFDNGLYMFKRMNIIQFVNREGKIIASTYSDDYLVKTKSGLQIITYNNDDNQPITVDENGSPSSN